MMRSFPDSSRRVQPLARAPALVPRRPAGASAHAEAPAAAETPAAGASTRLAATPDTPTPTPPVSILAYHRFAAQADDAMTVRTSTFEAQLAWLRAHGRPVVPLRDIVAWLADPAATLPPGAVAITVDDGHRSVYEMLGPIMLRERFPVTLFVYPPAIPHAADALSWAELRALCNTGLVDVQSHTWWHPGFNAGPRRQAPDAFRQLALAQLCEAREQIEQALSVAVDGLAWPSGLYDDELIALARHAGYRAAFTLEARPVTRATPPLAIPRYPMVDAFTPARLGRLFGPLFGPPSPAGAGPRP